MFFDFYLMSYLYVTFNNIGDDEGSTTSFGFSNQSDLDDYLQEYGECYNGYVITTIDGDGPPDII